MSEHDFYVIVNSGYDNIPGMFSVGHVILAEGVTFAFVVSIAFQDDMSFFGIEIPSNVTSFIYLSIY